MPKILFWSFKQQFLKYVLFLKVKFKYFLIIRNIPIKLKFRFQSICVAKKYFMIVFQSSMFWIENACNRHKNCIQKFYFEDFMIRDKEIWNKWFLGFLLQFSIAIEIVKLATICFLFMHFNKHQFLKKIDLKSDVNITSAFILLFNSFSFYQYSMHFSFKNLFEAI